MNMQTDKIMETASNWDGWHPYMHEFPGNNNEFGHWVNEYNRDVPHPFVGDSAQ